MAGPYLKRIGYGSRDQGRDAMSAGAGQLVLNGPLILAVPVAAAAGAITFISPCCLPLIPGYLSYLTGMSGADAERQGAGVRFQRATSGDTASGGRFGTDQTAVPPRNVAAGQTATTALAAASAATARPRAAPAPGRALAGAAMFVAGLSARVASSCARLGRA